MGATYGARCLVEGSVLMTQNRRIMLNIVATYGRSLYALVIGLFCGRWALMALGQVDYGLMGLIGGLTGAVSFLNTLLASAVGRFYAVNVGAAKKAGNGSLGSKTAASGLIRLWLFMRRFHYCLLLLAIR